MSRKVHTKSFLTWKMGFTEPLSMLKNLRAAQKKKPIQWKSRKLSRRNLKIPLLSYPSSHKMSARSK
jgi:hypothetical protein